MVTVKKFLHTDSVELQGTAGEFSLVAVFRQY